MISRSRLWSNFLHWPTNQLLSFHKFPQKIIASCCSHSYPQGWRKFTVLLSVTFDRSKSSNTECVQTKYICSAISSSGRTTQTHHQYGAYHLQRYPFRAWYTYGLFRTSTAPVIRWYSRWWHLSCGFLGRLECQPTMSSTTASKAQTQLLL